MLTQHEQAGLHLLLPVVAVTQCDAVECQVVLQLSKHSLGLAVLLKQHLHSRWLKGLEAGSRPHTHMPTDCAPSYHADAHS